MSWDGKIKPGQLVVITGPKRLGMLDEVVAKNSHFKVKEMDYKRCVTLKTIPRAEIHVLMAEPETTLVNLGCLGYLNSIATGRDLFDLLYTTNATVVVTTPKHREFGPIFRMADVQIDASDEVVVTHRCTSSYELPEASKASEESDEESDWTSYLSKDF